MIIEGKATRIEPLNFKTPQMRVFHMAWLAFFLCFFGWFGLAPMLVIIREDLGLTTDQIVTTNMLAVASAVIMRVFIGWCCDRVGPRLTYTWLMVLGSIPVMSVGLASSYETFLLMRVAIGALGASFVITQYHTSVMFAPNCVGTASAVTAGLGNSGAGATYLLMPLLFAVTLTAVGSEALAWRLVMIVPGVALAITGVAYYLLTTDAPEGNFSELRAQAIADGKKPNAQSSFLVVCSDYRVWALFAIYGLCFGVELLIDSQIALYLVDDFEMNLAMAGLVGGLFGAMGIFARPLGGMVADRFGARQGLRGRVFWLFIILFCEGVALMLFSRVTGPVPVVLCLAGVGLFVHACCGATYAIVPFVKPESNGLVSGIVGAGGNALAVALMFLFKPQLSGLAWSDAFLLTGTIVAAGSFLVLTVSFSPETERRVRREMAQRLGHAGVEPLPARA
ncbi:MAG: MFS transporter [Marinobacter nauticus]|nr:MFS transporter [Marinobacter nauticus]